MGLEHPDDAAVYRMPGGDQLVQTVDLIAPIVNDPFMYGKIACANSLSDVYAMGGRPLVAMNIVCFPAKTHEVKILRDVMRGSIELLKEAGCSLVGGHTVADEEFKYGFSVSGVIEGGDILSIDKAQVGNVLVLTKPVGTGIVNKAVRAGKLEDSASVYQQAEQSMAALNMLGAQAARAAKATAATDITGFGLAGHCAQFARASKVTFELDRSAIPVFDGVRELVAQGHVAGRASDNRDAYAGRVRGVSSDEESAILYDPQTSGGILATIPEDQVDNFVNTMKGWTHGVHVIGRVIAEGSYDLEIR